MIPQLTTSDIGPMILRPRMPERSSAPTPQFAITVDQNLKMPFERKIIKVPEIQIQSSQTVNLNFGPAQGRILTWPHVSVATLIPADPQPFTLK